MNVPTLIKEVSLDYVVRGHSAGVPTIFLHGFTDSYKSFSRIMPLLPGSMCSIAVSQRGHGDSDRPEAGYSPSDFAKDIAMLMDRLELPDAVIVGHSMGATVAQRFAIDFPERIRKLVLVGSFFNLKDHLDGQTFRDSVVSTLEDPIDPAIVRGFQVSTISKPVPNTFLDDVILESLKVPSRIWKSTLEALIESDFTGELGNIRVPTLLLWGDGDTFAGRTEQDRLLSSIPGSRLKVYPGIGHWPHWEVPGRVAVDIANFVMGFRSPVF